MHDSWQYTTNFKYDNSSILLKQWMQIPNIIRTQRVHALLDKDRYVNLFLTFRLLCKRSTMFKYEIIQLKYHYNLLLYMVILSWFEDKIT